MRVLMGGYVLALTGGLVCFFVDRSLAGAVSTGGVVIVQAGVLAWIALRDPVGRWPKATGWERVSRVLTFKNSDTEEKR